MAPTRMNCAQMIAHDVLTDSSAPALLWHFWRSGGDRRAPSKFVVLRKPLSDERLFLGTDKLSHHISVLEHLYSRDSCNLQKDHFIRPDSDGRQPDICVCQKILKSRYLVFFGYFWKRVNVHLAKGHRVFVFFILGNYPRKDRQKHLAGTAPSAHANK